MIMVETSIPLDGKILFELYIFLSIHYYSVTSYYTCLITLHNLRGISDISIYIVIISAPRESWILSYAIIHNVCYLHMEQQYFKIINWWLYPEEPVAITITMLSMWWHFIRDSNYVTDAIVYLNMQRKYLTLWISIHYIWN